ncbi:hypothetical protein MHBO_001397, partial [Bonamia ostreae]
ILSKMNGNIGVSHQITDFEETPRILTLEDELIVGKDGKLNEKDDTLHSAELREEEIAKRNIRRRARLPDAEDRFGDSLLPGSSSILPQYNEPETDLAKSNFSLNHPNFRNQNELKSSNKNDEAKSAILKDLKQNRKLSSDYFSRDEFTINKQRKLKKSRKSRINDKTEKPEIVANLKIVSRGSRRRKSSIILKNKKRENGENEKNTETEKVLKMDDKKFLLEKERERQFVQNKEAKAAEKAVLDKVRDNEVDDEDEDDLYKIMADQRNALFMNAAEISDKIRKSIDTQNRKKFLEENIKNGYNETEDFLQSIEIKRNDKFNADDFIKPENTNFDKSYLTENNKNRSTKNKKSNQNDTEQDKIEKNETNEETLKYEPVLDKIVGSEPLASSSVSDALKLFKMRGFLSGKDKHDFIGRQNDEKPSFFKENELNKSNINLEYLDPKTGRRLTRKQAFRNLSHIFHGRNPGDIKKSKLKRDMKNFRDRHAKNSTETPTGLVSKTKKSAKRLNRPFVTLDNNKNAAFVKLDKTGKFAK